MEDLYLDEMAAPGRDFVLAVPGRHQEVVHMVLPRLAPAAPAPLRRRLRSVACEFPDRRRLRVSMRLAAEVQRAARPGG